MIMHGMHDSLALDHSRFSNTGSTLLGQSSLPFSGPDVSLG